MTNSANVLLDEQNSAGEQHPRWSAIRRMLASAAIALRGHGRLGLPQGPDTVDRWTEMLDSPMGRLYGVWDDIVAEAGAKERRTELANIFDIHVDTRPYDGSRDDLVAEIGAEAVERLEDDTRVQALDYFHFGRRSPLLRRGSVDGETPNPVADPFEVADESIQPGDRKRVLGVGFNKTIDGLFVRVMTGSDDPNAPVRVYALRAYDVKGGPLELRYAYEIRQTGPDQTLWTATELEGKTSDKVLMRSVVTAIEDFAVPEA